MFLLCEAISRQGRHVLSIAIKDIELLHKWDRSCPGPGLQSLCKLPPCLAGVRTEDYRGVCRTAGLQVSLLTPHSVWLSDCVPPCLGVDWDVTACLLPQPPRPRLAWTSLAGALPPSLPASLLPPPSLPMTEMQPPARSSPTWPDIASLRQARSLSISSRTRGRREAGREKQVAIEVSAITSWGDDGWTETMTSHHQHMTTDNTQHQPSPPPHPW